MKNLDQIDPLPKFESVGTYTRPDGAQIWSKRQHKEWQKAVQAADGEDWRPTDNPLIEVNGKGQMRTKDYPLPEPPETDIPIPCVIEDEPAYGTTAWAIKVLTERGSYYKEALSQAGFAEPQTQTASQMEQGGRAFCSGDKDLGPVTAREVAAQFDGWIAYG
jgi:hypothetical protein